MHFFSVLLSLYYKESPQHLRQSLNSIFHQSVLATEIVLVEDGPLTEELYQVVSEYSQRYSELKVVPRMPAHSMATRQENVRLSIRPPCNAVVGPLALG